MLVNIMDSNYIQLNAKEGTPVRWNQELDTYELRSDLAEKIKKENAKEIKEGLEKIMGYDYLYTPKGDSKTIYTEEVKWQAFWQKYLKE